MLDSLSRAPKQYPVILKLFQLKGGKEKLIKAKELQKESGASANILKALVKKGVLVENWLRTDRVSYKVDKPLPPKPLNPHQTEALLAVKEQFEQDKVVLLHGYLLG